MLTAPVFRNLKAHWPDAHLSVLVKPQFAAAIAGNPCVDEVLAYRGLRRALKDIRERGITHLLDLHANWRTFWIRALARVPDVSVYRKDALARRLFVLFRWSSPALVKHTLDRYLEALAPWGVPVRHRDLALGDYSPPAGPRPGGARVLLVQTSFLGDTLLTLPLARRLKEVLPGCRLAVLTRPDTAELFRASPWVDEVLEDDKRGRDAGAFGLWALARGLRGRFDLALVAHRSLRSALLVWLARVPFRIGFSSSAGWFFFHRAVLFSWGMPELERNLGLLLPLAPGLRAEGGDSVYLRGRREASASVGSLLAGARGSGPLVGLHPGSAWETKRWLPERFAALARRLMSELGATVALIGGPEDAELARRVAAEAPGALNLAGRTSLAELMELCGRLELLVTNDSGPMHVAAASGVPTLAIFGPTTRELGFFPYGAGHRVIEKDLACRPCGLHGRRRCPEGHFLCMRLISVEEVFAAAAGMLASRRRAPEAAR